MRGMFTCGVTDVFMERGIGFDGMIGVSAGAAFGCNVKSGQAGRAIRYNKRFCRDPRFVSAASLLLSGDLYNARFGYERIPRELDPFDGNAFRADPMEFWCVCTDADTAEPVYHRLEKGDAEDIQWIRASASMPIVSRPVLLDGRRLLDGGVADPIPLEYFEKLGYDRCVVILTRPRDYVKAPAGHARALRYLLRRTPELADAMLRRHELYARQQAYVARREAQGAALVIRPEEDPGIPRVCRDPRELSRVYAMGRRAGEQWADRARAFMTA